MSWTASVTVAPARKVKVQVGALSGSDRLAPLRSATVR
jgi:hypothetical protein